MYGDTVSHLLGLGFSFSGDSPKRPNARVQKFPTGCPTVAQELAKFDLGLPMFAELVAFWPTLGYFIVIGWLRSPNFSRNWPEARRWPKLAGPNWPNFGSRCNFLPTLRRSVGWTVVTFRDTWCETSLQLSREFILSARIALSRAGVVARVAQSGVVGTTVLGSGRKSAPPAQFATS